MDARRCPQHRVSGRVVEQRVGGTGVDLNSVEIRVGFQVLLVSSAAGVQYTAPTVSFLAAPWVLLVAELFAEEDQKVLERVDAKNSFDGSLHGAVEFSGAPLGLSEKFAEDRYRVDVMPSMPCEVQWWSLVTTPKWCKKFNRDGHDKFNRDGRVFDRTAFRELGYVGFWSHWRSHAHLCTW